MTDTKQPTPQMIEAFEQHYDASWDDASLRLERLAWTAGFEAGVVGMAPKWTDGEPANLQAAAEDAHEWLKADEEKLRSAPLNPDYERRVACRLALRQFLNDATKGTP